MPIAFDHITAPSKNLEASIAFYKKIGMTLIEIEPKHHAHFENKEHHTIFTVYYNTKRPEDDVIIYFEVTHIELLEVRFRELASPAGRSEYFIKTNYATSWGGHELHLKDPDGNCVILYQKNQTGNTPPWQTATYES